MVKFKGKFVPFEQHESFEEKKSTGRMKQNVPNFRHVSTGQKMCAIVGNNWSGNAESRGLQPRATPPKTTASVHARLPRKASPVEKMPPVGVTIDQGQYH